MRRDWFRFDPMTLLATLFVGLVPALLLILISYFYIQGLSWPLLDLMRTPHQQGVDQRSLAISNEVDAWIRTLREQLSQAIEAEPDGAGPLASFGDWEWVSEVRWYLPPDRTLLDSFAREDRERGEAIVSALGHDPSPDRRQQSLEALASLPLEVEDPMGFSYAAEAMLHTQNDPDASRHRELMHHAASLERTTLRAHFEASGGVLRLPGMPVEVVPFFVAPPVSGGDARVDSEDPDLLWVGTPAPGDGTLVCGVRVPPLLQSCLENVLALEQGRSGISYQLVPPGSSEPPPESVRVWAERSLNPPFSNWQITSASAAGDEVSPLVFLDRIEGFHYLWGGLIVLTLGVLGSLFLAAVVSRRVELSRRKDTFLRLVSHELRTPVASLGMLSETLLLNRVRNDDERDQFLQQMQSETSRLGDLVERVLEFGRASSGGIRVREVVTDPGELVEGIVDRFRSHFPDGPAVTVQCTQQFHPVLLDQEAIRGVVLNFLTNAQKYSPADTTIEVTVGEESRHLFIRVRDHGVGIRRRDLRRIFRPFERGAHGKDKAGFGLGLAYCREVALAHRGKIRVRSRVGEGSAFTLEIPLVPAMPKGASDG